MLENFQPVTLTGNTYYMCKSWDITEVSKERMQEMQFDLIHRLKIQKNKFIVNDRKFLPEVISSGIFALSKIETVRIETFYELLSIWFSLVITGIWKLLLVNVNLTKSLTWKIRKHLHGQLLYKLVLQPKIPSYILSIQNVNCFYLKLNQLFRLSNLDIDWPWLSQCSERSQNIQ